MKCTSCATENLEGSKWCNNCGYRFEEKTTALRPGGEVVVVDVKMPFWSMVVFMVKWAIASIPALIILYVIGMILVAILGGMSMMTRSRMR